MNTHARKKHRTKCQPIAKQTSRPQIGSTATFQFVDNRTESDRLKKLQETTSNSPGQFTKLQALTDNRSSTVVQRRQVEHLPEDTSLPLQLKAESDPPKQRGDTGQTENRTGMPDNLKAGIENLSGLSMDDVKIHYDSSKPAQLNARAFAQGQNIELAPGEEKHLPHEAWHVVQQLQGRVKPTLQDQGESINDDTALEQEADVMGAKSLQMTTNQVATDATSLTAPSSQRRKRVARRFPGPVQRLKVNDRDVAIAALMSYEVEEYTGYLDQPLTRPSNVDFEHGDAEKLRNSLTILGRMNSLVRQIERTSAQLVTAVGGAPQVVPNVPLEHPGFAYDVQLSTRETALGVAVDAGGPYNLWSGTKESTKTVGGAAAGHFGGYGRAEANSGEYKAEHAQGFMMADTQEHFDAQAILYAAEGQAHGYAPDPQFHRDFVMWLEQDITSQDVRHLNARDGGNRQDQQYQDGGAFKARSFLMTDPGTRNPSPAGIEYVENTLQQLRGGAQADHSRSAVEQNAPIGSVSTWVNRDPSIGAHQGQTLIGLHDAHFHTAWDPTSKTTALNAARSFTPVASFGVPGHFNPTATVQHNIEIPTLQAEAIRQRDQLRKLADMLHELNQARADADVADGIQRIREAANEFVDGANLLTIAPLTLADNNWLAARGGPSPARVREEQRRGTSRATMADARTKLLVALERIKGSALYKQTISKM